jgi:hypothetical protein
MTAWNGNVMESKRYEIGKWIWNITVMESNRYGMELLWNATVMSSNRHLI